jgi:AAA domain
MPIVNIAPATRKGAHLLIQLGGGPSSGKTLTALRVARGIVGPEGKIGMLDTESGRGRFYADKIAGGFLHGDLTPPYTPKRYLEAIRDFVEYGVDILVIDSGSHVWEGVGGVLEMADKAEQDGKKGLLKWLEPKTEYRKLVNFILSTRLHIIICSRAKQPIEERWIEVDGKPRKTLVTLPWEPIQDKRLKYEMTIYVPMLLNGTYEIDQPRLKVPGDLAHLFTGDLLTEKTGEAIGAWVAGGDAVDPTFELFRKEAYEVAGAGREFFIKWWNSKPVKPRRKALVHELGNLESIAAAADDERARQERAEDEARRRADDEDKLDNPFAGRLPLEEVGGRPAPRAA